MTQYDFNTEASALAFISAHADDYYIECEEVCCADGELWRVTLFAD